ncbi:MULTISPECIES: MerR family transcriptional regulator [unclassified Modestobacter]
MPEERLMRIGELAARSGISLPTLRHYDEIGLLMPSARTAGNFRLYSEADFERLMVIRRMKPLGFSVEEMRELLQVVSGLRAARRAALPDPAELRSVLGQFVAAAHERRHRLRRHLSMADEFISILESEESAASSDSEQSSTAS